MAILSGATQNNHTTPTATQETKPTKIPQPQKGTFWPKVRQRMKEKAIQLYIKDHPNSEIIPETKILRKEGYLQTAKTLALREVYQEKKNGKKQLTRVHNSNSES